jgi:signal transduction histidine kinase/ActR/RegA family two-component response regulator
METAEALNELLRQIAVSGRAEFVTVHGADELDVEPEYLKASFLNADEKIDPDCVARIVSHCRSEMARLSIRFVQALAETTLNEDPVVQASGIKSAVVVPLELMSAPNASLVILWTKNRKQFTEAELENITTSARLVGILCKSIVVMKTCLEQSKRLSALVELSTTIYSTLNYQVVLNKVIDLATSFVSASYATIYLLSSDGTKLKSLMTNADTMRESIMGSDLTIGKGAEGRAAAQGEGVIVNGLSASGSEDGESAMRGSRIAVPLSFSGNTIGVLCVHRDSGGLFTLEDLQFISIFARQAADVIENARMFRDLQLAYNKLSCTQEQMLETEKLRALGEMACGVAHDFNNRLGAILGRAQLLQEQISDQRVLDGLREIEGLALKGAETVRRTQEFARVRSKTVKERVSINQVVQDAVETTKPFWKDQAQLNLVEVELATDLTATQPIAGSLGELVDALSNMIQNSVEAMPNGGKITVNTCDQGDEVVIEIVDNGVGMTLQDREKMFYPFFTTKGKGKTGLGLSVAYGILTRHQVAVDVVTEEGKGTRISMIFPARPELAEREEKKAPRGTVKRLRVLLVDDDESLLSVVFELLSSLGHDTATASEGIEALAKFGEREFDIVITDLGLPGMSGWDIAKAVKLKDPNMPVIIISGWGAQIAESDISSRGVDLVLPKPFTLAQLEEAIGTVLEEETVGTT